MKTKTNWNLGNFTVALEVEANEAMAGKLQNLGLLYLGQRVSEVDKILGGFEVGADGKAKRKKDWKRVQVDYSEALRHALSAAFSTLTLPDESKLECDVLVGRYDGPEKAALVYKREKAKLSEKESKGILEEFLLEFCKYDGETHGEDGEFSPDALKACKVAIDKFLAEQI